VPVLIDPKIRNFDSYRPATLVTPNHHEALRLTNTEEESEARCELPRTKFASVWLVTRC